MHDGSAIFVDFDNVFSALWAIDGGLAIRFASDPATWLTGLGAMDAPDGSRRWRVARCYMNPSGWVSAPGEQNDRIWFYRFRGDFVKAGFEVVDCPTLTRGAKNAADIRIVIDALDMLGHRNPVGEFVFVSGDSDFTPLLYRLRAEDCRTVIVAPGRLSSAYAAVADAALGFDRIGTLLGARGRELPEPLLAGMAIAQETASADAQMFAALVRRRYGAASAPLNLSSLSSEILRELPGAKSSDWFGYGTFRKALDRLALPDVRFAQHFLWNERKHQPPAPLPLAGSVPDPSTPDNPNAAPS
ncbi:NYN domain-containing protein [Sphingomonas sp. R647]|uniref:NYN domain-containing protein n=1 Tax=Sphingomonas sp. R647 TaxID=2875233 RepID=UPI001CD21DBC|nr:NYN domain-containing protein [Sphingomonas sp. R647]MCA1200137.1 NYN domain-containing protein [Sphingomonas sp. R647]